MVSYIGRNRNSRFFTKEEVVMHDFTISKEQAKQFAFDCFDIIVVEIKKETEEKGGVDSEH